MSFHKYSDPPRAAFTPETFTMMLKGSRQWFGIFVRLVHGRQDGREYCGDAIKALLSARVQQLRN
jgi:hypothetical protein